MKKFLLPISFFVLIISSCRKDFDSEYPGIVWNSPADGIHINVYDTLHIDLHLTDNTGLVGLEVKLVDANLIPVMPSITVSLHGKSQNVTFDYPVDDIRITSGNYYLDAEISDGNNLKKSYRSVIITEAPQILKGFFAATRPNSNSLNVYQVDTSWAPSIFFNQVSDFTDLAVSNYWQQVYCNGSVTGNLHAQSIDGVTHGWDITPIATTQPYWGPLSVTGSNLWVSFAGEDKIKNIDQTGLQKNFAFGDVGFYPIHNLQIGNRLFSEQKDISSSTVKMVAYTNTGTPLQECLLGMNVVTMFEKDADNVYVLANNAGQGHLEIYDYNANGLWEPIVLPAGTITSAAQVDTNTVLVGMSSGTVYKFTYAPVGLLTWTSGINPNQMRYDGVNGKVFSAEGLNVKEYNYNPFSLTRTIALPDSVRDLELWYNR